MRNIYATLLCASIVIWWTLASYFRHDIPALLVFSGDDSHCDRLIEAVGVHCFGDFASIRTQGINAIPEGAEAVYSVSSRFFRLPFSIVEGLSSYRISVMIYILVCVLAMLYPFLDQLRQKSVRWSDVAMFGTCTLPFIAAIDRGNLIAFVPAFLYAYLKSVAREDLARTSLGISLMVAVKPQLIIFAAVPFVLKRFKLAILNCLFSIGVITLPYAVFGTDMFARLHIWLNDARAWSQSQTPTSRYPTNLSMQPLLHMIGITNLIGYIALLLVVSLLLVPSLLRQRVDRLKKSQVTEVGFIIATAFLLLSPITYPYYLVVLSPIVALLISEQAEGLVHTSIERNRNRLITACALIVLAPIAIPSSLKIGVTTLEPNYFNLYSFIQTGFLIMTLIGLLCVQYFANPSRKHV